MGCENCGGSCGGCAKALTLTEGELEILDLLAQIPFLSVARRIDDAAPFFPEGDAHSPEEYSLILQCLEKKGLISIDFDRPLKNAPAPEGFPIAGSMALTARGQSVLELLDLQGAQE